MFIVRTKLESPQLGDFNEYYCIKSSAARY